MKLPFVISVTLFACTTGLPQNTTPASNQPDSILVSISQKLNTLKSIAYDITRELNYSSENYHHLSTWTAFYDLQSKDTIAGFKYQIDDSTSKQVFNGTEKFEMDKINKSIAIIEDPDKRSVSTLSALYNSIITLRNILPVLIKDKSAIKKITDTIINSTAYYAIIINIGKRRIQNLGKGFDVMTTKSDFIYTIIIHKNNLLPLQVIQSNNLNNDFIKTTFTNLNTDPSPPAELSWYYSTYTKNFKPVGNKTDIPLLTNGSPAPEWNLDMHKSKKHISLGDLKGQVVLVDFWIKNCGPCIQSVPHLNALKNKFRNKNFTLISINAYDSEKDISWFCDKHNVDYPVLQNGKPVAEQYGVSAYPTFFIIDKSGKIIYANTGYSESTSAQIEKVIAGAL